MKQFKLNEKNEVIVPSDKVNLNGFLYIPKSSSGLVLFVHGSGSSRFSTRNLYVANLLNQAGFATLLFDLLTSEEDLIDTQTAQFRFDIDFLATRLINVTKWCLNQPIIQSLKIGYFGASTGGGAALVAAAREPKIVKAVVSRGGRPDLAGNFLTAVKAPTLLLVGGYDEIVIGLNNQAMTELNCTKRMDIISGATHLFEEPGTLDAVADKAKNWFISYLI